MKDSAVLLMDCPDRKGLVARVAGLLYEWGANILHADQHQDHELGLFFMRVEWGLADSTPLDGERTRAENVVPSPQPSSESLCGARFDLEGFKQAFAPLAAE